MTAKMQELKMADNKSENSKPDEDRKKPGPEDAKDDMHRAEETLGDAPSSGPNAQERSRRAD